MMITGLATIREQTFNAAELEREPIAVDAHPAPHLSPEVNGEDGHHLMSPPSTLPATALLGQGNPQTCLPDD
jgi:hypothetical protein